MLLTKCHIAINTVANSWYDIVKNGSISPKRFVLSRLIKTVIENNLDHLRLVRMRIAVFFCTSIAGANTAKTINIVQPSIRGFSLFSWVTVICHWVSTWAYYIISYYIIFCYMFLLKYRVLVGSLTFFVVVSALYARC